MEKSRPYIAAAVICENVLEEKNGSLSIIRIADKVEYDLQGAPADMFPVLQLKGLISFRSGDAKGEYQSKIKVIDPTGTQQGADILLPTVKLLGGDHNYNITLHIGLGVHHEGLHWFDVYLDDELITRIPLTVLRRPRELIQI
jgi:hypothetical protein